MKNMHKQVIKQAESIKKSMGLNDSYKSQSVLIRQSTNNFFYTMTIWSYRETVQEKWILLGNKLFDKFGIKIF